MCLTVDYHSECIDLTMKHGVGVITFACMSEKGSGERAFKYGSMNACAYIKIQAKLTPSLFNLSKRGL